MENIALNMVKIDSNRHEPTDGSNIDLPAKSIDQFGFTNPIIIADDDTILAGHGPF